MGVGLGGFLLAPMGQGQFESFWSWDLFLERSIVLGDPDLPARLTLIYKGAKFAHFQIVGQLVNAEQSRKDYANISNDLLAWIRQKIQELNDRRFPNSLKGIQEEMLRFKQYRTVEKPPK